MSLIALFLTATLAQTTPADTAQTIPAPPPQPITIPPYDVAILAGLSLAPDCGGLYGLQGRAFCVTAPLVQIGDLAEAYISDLVAKGWLVAAGDTNRVVFVRRKADQTCEGLQMQAFYNNTAVASPSQPGFLGFGVVPGDVCASRPQTGGTTP